MANNSQNSCLNCGSGLSGEYCSKCGQKHIGDALTLNYFIKSFVHEIANTDSRIWHTVTELIKHPGYVARRYVMGARQQYINPLRLCLVLIGIYIAFLALNGWLTVDYQTNTIDVDTKFKKVWADLYSNHRLFIYLGSMPIAAFAIRWGFYKTGFNYIATLTMLLFIGALYSIYGLLLAFVFSVFGFNFFSPAMDLSEMGIALVVYFQGVRSFYQYDWIKTTFATLWILFLQLASAYVITFMAIIVIVAWS